MKARPHSSAPAAIRVEGGSFGFQIGGSNTDIVMLVMNEKGMRRLLEDKVTLGAEATVAAGPVGRQTSASTDVQLSAEMLSWSRSKGLFAGIALHGATMRPDNGECGIVRQQADEQGNPDGRREAARRSDGLDLCVEPLLSARGERDAGRKPRNGKA